MSADIVTQLVMFSLDDGTDALNKLLAESVDEIERQKAIAEALYTALAQMKHRRGIHVDDVNLVLDAMEAWEEENEQLAHD